MMFDRSLNNNTKTRTEYWHICYLLWENYLIQRYVCMCTYAHTQSCMCRINRGNQEDSCCLRNGWYMSLLLPLFSFILEMFHKKTLLDCLVF